MIYSSPNKRISFGKNFLWVRNNRLYRGIGGSKANGAGFRPKVDPAAVAVAHNLNDPLIARVANRYASSCSRSAAMNAHNNGASAFLALARYPFVSNSFLGTIAHLKE